MEWVCAACWAPPTLEEEWAAHLSYCDTVELVETEFSKSTTATPAGASEHGGREAHLKIAHFVFAQIFADFAAASAALPRAGDV